MNILDTILEHKHKEVAARKALHPVTELERSAFFQAHTFSLKEHLLHPGKSGIIAEIKRKSPSKGIINARLSVERTSVGYVEAGASALSVLTDEEFFGGSSEDLMAARKLNVCPILRKDFVIDEYQITEAKSIGADAILLIAAALDPEKLKTLCRFAHTLKLEVLMEVHNEKELKDNLEAGADLIGVNNRNLKTFELSIEISKQLSAMIPDEIVKVSESGIETPEAVMDLYAYGFRGFLIGQTFMQTGSPEAAAKEFILSLNKLKSNRR